MTEQHITTVSEAREEAVGRGCDHGPSVASTVHSLRRTSKTDLFSAGERFDQAIEDRMF